MRLQIVFLCTLTYFFQVLVAPIVATTKISDEGSEESNQASVIEFNAASESRDYDTKLTELTDESSIKHQNNEVDYLLNESLKSLKECVDKKSFNFILFEERVLEIRENIFRLDHLVATTKPVNEELLKKHRFTREMFRAMITFNEFRKNYQENSDLQDRLLAEIKTLSVLRYELYDSNGRPDPQIEGYDAYLSELIARWTVLKEERELLKKSASIVRLILDIDFNRVRKSLVELAAHSVEAEINEYKGFPF